MIVIEQLSVFKCGPVGRCLAQAEAAGDSAYVHVYCPSKYLSSFNLLISYFTSTWQGIGWWDVSMIIANMIPIVGTAKGGG